MAAMIWKQDNMPIRVDIALSFPPNTPVYSVSICGNPRTSDALKNWSESRKYWSKVGLRTISVNKDTYIVLAETPKHDRGPDLERVMRKIFEHLAGKVGKGLMVDENSSKYYDKESADDAEGKLKVTMAGFGERELEVQRRWGWSS